jgi:hypothetical protein
MSRSGHAVAGQRVLISPRPVAPCLGRVLIEVSGPDVRFSNRPVRVKRFLTVSDWDGRCHSQVRASLRNRR